MRNALPLFQPALTTKTTKTTKKYQPLCGLSGLCGLKKSNLESTRHFVLDLSAEGSRRRQLLEADRNTGDCDKSLRNL
jgi:hypothetical protein